MSVPTVTIGRESVFLNDLHLYLWRDGEDGLHGS